MEIEINGILVQINEKIGHLTYKHFLSLTEKQKLYPNKKKIMAYGLFDCDCGKKDCPIRISHLQDSFNKKGQIYCSNQCSFQKEHKSKLQLGQIDDLAIKVWNGFLQPTIAIDQLGDLYKEGVAYWNCYCIHCKIKFSCRAGHITNGDKKSCGNEECDFHIEFNKERYAKNSHDNPEECQMKTIESVFYRLNNGSGYSDGGRTIEEFIEMQKQYKCCFWCESTKKIITNIFNSSGEGSDFAKENGNYEYFIEDRVINNNQNGSKTLHIQGNIVPSCKRCNDDKNDKSIFDWFFHIQNRKSLEDVNNNLQKFKVVNLSFVKDILQKNNTLFKKIGVFCKTRTKPYKNNSSVDNYLLVRLREYSSKGQIKRKCKDLNQMHLLNKCINKEQVAELICNPNGCAYCYRKFDFNNPEGIDRVDSNITYLPDNCVSCCVDCNKGKNDDILALFLERNERLKKGLEKYRWMLTFL